MTRLELSEVPKTPGGRGRRAPQGGPRPGGMRVPRCAAGV